IASRAAAAGARLAFDPVPRMVYRRYGGNCAPLHPPFTMRGVLRAAALVVRHYALLLDGPPGRRHGWRRPFDAARARAEAFHLTMRTSPDVLRRYVRALNRLPPQHV